MDFKAYDILSSLVPGFLALLILLHAFNIQFNKDLVIAYTAIAFLLGYVMNSVSSWMEEFYFWTWSGKPARQMLQGEDIWKVRFYESKKAKALLEADSSSANASDDELFAIAMRKAHGQKDTRVDDFNALYAFSRSLLTTIFIGTIVLLIDHYNDWRYYAVLIPSLLVVWLRCKQRAYYYSREVLNVYLQLKSS